MDLQLLLVVILSVTMAPTPLLALICDIQRTTLLHLQEHTASTVGITILTHLLMDIILILRKSIGATFIATARTTARRTANIIQGLLNENRRIELMDKVDPLRPQCGIQVTRIRQLILWRSSQLTMVVLELLHRLLICTKELLFHRQRIGRLSMRIHLDITILVNLLLRLPQISHHRLSTERPAMAMFVGNRRFLLSASVK
jgi:hypothetical protein